MRKVSLLYTALIIAAVIVGAVAIVALYRSGSASVPGWPAFFQPGPLSLKHAFLNDSCESCHTPTRGIEATTCITCHATAAADLGKQSTAFHANVQDCRGCHVEHEGGSRPIKMDHSVLLHVGLSSSGAWHGRSGIRRRIMDDIAGYFGIPASDAAEKSALDCATCHSNQDPHRALFGRECADCHTTAKWQIAAFVHPSPTSRDCAQCHQAPPSHYTMHFHMVSKMIAGQEHAEVSQCYLCHQTNAWNDIKGVGWYKHH